MKLCWENLDRLYLTKNGNLRMQGGNEYIYRDKCKTCGLPFLSVKRKVKGRVIINEYCCISCGMYSNVRTSSEFKSNMSKKFSGKNNPRYGVTLPDELKKRISDAQKGEKGHNFGRPLSSEIKIKISKALSGKNSPMYGKTLPLETKTKISNTLKGRKLPIKTIEKMKGENNSAYKGGVIDKNLPLYDTYVSRLEQFGEVKPIIKDGLKLLQIRCHFCKTQFIPTRNQVVSKLYAFNNTDRGECNMYCSSECKMNCSTYRRIKRPKEQEGIIRTYSGSELKIWAREVLRRYDFTCACCGDRATVGHHRKSKIEFPEFALDPTFGIALCRWCHIYIFHTGKNASVHYVDKCRELIIKK